jgi:hypothetical protein
MTAARVCSVEGCERPHASRGYCEAHYFRVRRTGSPGSPEVWDRRRPTCSVTGCDRPHEAHGYCLNHWRHVQKGGHPDHVGGPRFGEDNTAWRGDDIGYTSAHQRVARTRGPARKYACVDCGNRARHWSYNHADPSQRLHDGKYAYSADPAMYDPRCVPCHKRFDLEHLAEVAS